MLKITAILVALCSVHRRTGELSRCISSWLATIFSPSNANSKGPIKQSLILLKDLVSCLFLVIFINIAFVWKQATSLRWQEHKTQFSPSYTISSRRFKPFLSRNCSSMISEWHRTLSKTYESSHRAYGPDVSSRFDRVQIVTVIISWSHGERTILAHFLKDR